MIDEEAENNLRKIKDVTLDFFHKETMSNGKAEYYIECVCRNIKIDLHIAFFKTTAFEVVHLIKNNQVVRNLKEKDIPYFKHIIYQMRNVILSKKEYRLRYLLGQLNVNTNLERTVF